MQPEYQAALDRIEAEIAKLIEARETLVKLFGPAPSPQARTPRRPRNDTRITAPGTSGKQPAGPRAASKPARNDTSKSADADTITKPQAKVLKFLDKNGPSQLADVVKGTGNPRAGSTLANLVSLGLAEDNDGHFRVTDKCADAALA